MIKVAMFGSRRFPVKHQPTVTNFVKYLGKLDRDVRVLSILSGGARGVDTFAADAARKFGIQLEVFDADWRKYKKSAGIVRNIEMTSESTFGVAFWADRAKPSSGTAHSLTCLRKQHKAWGEYDAKTAGWWWCGVEVPPGVFAQMVLRRILPKERWAPDSLEWCWPIKHQHVDPHRGCVLR